MTESFLRTGPVPRYVQLADVLRQRIRRGVWAPGDLVPSIESLMREFEVARVTVRQAINLLAQDGLLSPQRGRGTFVTAEAGRDRRLVVHGTLDKLAEMYRGDRPDLSNIAETDELPPLTERDGRPAPSYFHMRRVHARDGERYCIASIYIDERVYGLAPERLRTEVVLPILTALEGVEICDGHQSMHIATADVGIATDLRIALNAPVVEVRRLLRTADQTVIYFCDAIYRGDYVRLEMDLTP
ncbi:MAG: GntR family transcriptional regulator [Devosia sp.]